MLLSTKARILVYLRSRQPSYISGSELESQAHDWATKASTISRRARELEDDGRIERKLVGKAVWYRLTQAEPRMSVSEANSFIQSLNIKKVKQEQLNV